MPLVTKRMSWGKKLEKILHHFSPDEMKAIAKEGRRLIRDFLNPELEGEGYRCTLIPFEMFEYGFVLSYDFDEELWMLEVGSEPNFDSPDCTRKRPPKNPGKNRKGSRREGGAHGGRRRPDLAWFAEAETFLYNITALLTAFWANQRLLLIFSDLTRFVRAIEPLHVRDERVWAYIRMCNAIAEQQSQGCRNLVQLMRSKVNEAFSFLGPLSSFSPFIRGERLWDVTLFGALSEPA